MSSLSPITPPPSTPGTGAVRLVGVTATPPPPLLVMAWKDPVVDELGIDPRSGYAESCWLPLLGPTSMWLLRRFAAEFDTSPEGFSLDTIDAARSIGIGTRGGQSGPFHRSIERCVRFGLVRHDDHGIIAVRRRLPLLTRAQLRRLPRALQAAHEEWLAERRQRSTHPSADAHAARLARTLLDLGVSPREVEEQLARWNFDPSATRRAMQAACAQTDA